MTTVQLLLKPAVVEMPTMWTMPTHGITGAHIRHFSLNLSQPEALLAVSPFQS